ncbi:MAG TPA: ComEA family DNA-binding protein [Acidimicrobiales bacterium]|nr:ComEA family DNA-binding protein [Acidimicrobiales bacterium]
MSELLPPAPGADLARPSPPRSWRESLGAVAESLDLSPRRLAVGLVVLAVVGVVAWRVLAPAPPAAEMELPFATPDGASSDVAAGGPEAGGPASSGAAGAGGPGGAPGSTEAGGSTAATSPGSPTEAVVHVAGAVTQPGVQRLPAGARVVDAVDRAGGATPDADLARVNLAAPVQDGQQVYIPRVGEVAGGGAPAPAGGDAGGVPGGGEGGASDAAAGLVDLNTATAEQLETLPGVGPITAQAILDHRATNGPFTSVDQLLDVRGIGDAKLEQVRDLVVVQ